MDRLFANDGVNIKPYLHHVFISSLCFSFPPFFLSVYFFGGIANQFVGYRVFLIIDIRPISVQKLYMLAFVWPSIYWWALSIKLYRFLTANIWKMLFFLNGSGNYVNNRQVYHDKHIFLEDYKEMKRRFKIYVYPHRQDEPFANVLLPVDFEPGGNYASESYFKKVLLKSQFMTNDPNEADLFFLPFSIARLRHDPRIGVGGIQDFIRDYNLNISQRYPYWNRTGGADHFYVACHSIGRIAMEKASEVKHNAIQLVCSSSYFLPGYIPHKDACLPQIWPREGEPPDLVSSKRWETSLYICSSYYNLYLRIVKDSYDPLLLLLYLSKSYLSLWYYK